MTHIKIRFGSDPGLIDAELRRTMDQMFRLVTPIFSTGHQRWRPQIDICECEEEIMILVELAGVNTEDLQVEITRRSLKISGWRRARPLKESARYRQAEISYGYFERELLLPVPIDTESATATYADGLLQICVRKIRENATYKIAVRSA
jgi:HSP20 family protein